MEVRSIQEGDIRKCARLYASVFTSEPWNEEWTEETAFLRLNHFYQSTGFVGLLAEYDDIVGFVLGHTEPFENSTIYYLREMCVMGSIQSKGVGGKLYKALDCELAEKSVKSIYLTTERDIPAASFYMKNGFNLSQKMGFYAKSINA